jgi:hypothetical protein
MAHELAEYGRQTILRQHMCAHRVDEFLAIFAALEGVRPQGGEARCAVVGSYVGRAGEHAH